MFRNALASLRTAAADAVAAQKRCYATHLANIAPAKGSTRANTRLGRGQGSTKGGTSGRGHKGQNARSGNGKPSPQFAGGQTPLYKLMPKKGFLNFTRREYAPLSIAKLQSWIAQGRIDTSLPITVGTVIRSNLVHGIKGWSGVKLLGKPDPNQPLPPLEIELSRFSKSAARAVINAGGNVTAVYHTPLGLRQEMWPEKFAGREIRNAAPIRRTDIEYYTNPKNYGYLAKYPEFNPHYEKMFPPEPTAEEAQAAEGKEAESK